MTPCRFVADGRRRFWLTGVCQTQVSQITHRSLVLLNKKQQVACNFQPVCLLLCEIVTDLQWCVAGVHTLARGSMLWRLHGFAFEIVGSGPSPIQTGVKKKVCYLHFALLCMCSSSKLLPAKGNLHLNAKVLGQRLNVLVLDASALISPLTFCKLTFCV